MNYKQTDRVARAIWARRLADDDPDTHSLTWDEAIDSTFITIAYEAQEVRRDAKTAIAAILPDRAAFDAALDDLVDVIKGFEPESTIEDKKTALRALVYGTEDEA